MLTLDSTYRIGNRSFIVEPVSYTHLDVYKRQIEACCDLPAEQRIIHLQLRKQYRSLFYRLENPYSDTSRGIRIGEYHGCLLYTSRCV